MPNNQLQATLRQLRDELSHTEGVDPETVARLQAIISDIERNVQRRDAAASVEVESTAASLQNLLLKFEADHPQLSVTIGRVADALAAMGI